LERFEKNADKKNGHVRSADTTDTLRSLFNDLFAAAIPFLTETHLVIIPDGPLHLVPFHALFDGKSYLGDRYEISYAPSSSVFKQNAGRRVITSDKHVVAAEAATRAGFFGDAAEADSVHIQTEIVYRPNRPLFSCFKIADEWVTALDLFSTFCECNVATLVGKVTGISAATSGEDLHALVRAVLYAGSRSLLLGLWTSDGESTEKFLSDFHARRRSGQTKSASVKYAMQRLRQEYPHPFYWAPFVLFGQS
jgi:CHAT domain-containing protein